MNMTIKRNRFGVLVCWPDNQPHRDSKLRSPKESVEQKQLNSHCKLKFPDEYDSMWHTVNESGDSGNGHYGSSLRAMGRKPGVSDWIVMIPTERHPGLFIELKRQHKRDGGAKPDQRKFLIRQESLGYACAVAHGYEAALHLIEMYLGGVDFRRM